MIPAGQPAPTVEPCPSVTRVYLLAFELLELMAEEDGDQ